MKQAASKGIACVKIGDYADKEEPTTVHDANPCK
jgi:hypothetical protein